MNKRETYTNHPIKNKFLIMSIIQQITLTILKVIGVSNELFKIVNLCPSNAFANLNECI